jgi:hypothetical protein
MRKLQALQVRGVEEKKREEKRVFKLEKAYFSSCSSIITPLPLVFKDELESSKLELP